MRRLVLGAAACGLLALVLQVYAGYKRGSPITPGPATASLELVDASHDNSRLPFSAFSGQVDNVSWPYDFYSVPPREAQQARFVGGICLIVTYSEETGLDLLELSGDLARGRQVTAFLSPPDSRRSLVLVPDRERRKVMVLTQSTGDPEGIRLQTDVAVLDIPGARLRHLYRLPGDWPSSGPPAVWAGGGIVAARGQVLVFVDPTTRAVRELYRGSDASIRRLWPSPRGAWVALDRDEAMWGEPLRLAKRDVVVVNVATGQAEPIAHDPRRGYHHGMLGWEDDDSLLIWVNAGRRGDPRFRLYRAKLQPSHAGLR